MRICPRCRTPYSDSEAKCARDGTSLTSALAAINEQDIPNTLFGGVVGNYRLLGRLGEGGMGIVYEGSHLSIKKVVAVKVIHKDKIKDENALERFYQEAQSVAQLNHENIIQILDFGCTQDGRPYLVMEMLEGKPLHSVLLREGWMHPERAIKIAKQICRGLAAAHEKKIVHRDLKPENIFLVDSRGEPDFVKILDFGIAYQLQEKDPKRLTEETQVLGTPMYMAPEQARGKIDPRSDLYSLGVLLYEMVTGKLPFQGATSMDVVMKHLTEAPKPPSSIVSTVPVAVEEVILRAMAKKPDARYASAKDFLAALERAGASVLAEKTFQDPTPPFLREQAHLKKESPKVAPLASSQTNRSLWIALGVALVAIVVLLILLLGRQGVSVPAASAPSVVAPSASAPASAPKESPGPQGSVPSAAPTKDTTLSPLPKKAPPEAKKEPKPKKVPTEEPLPDPDFTLTPFKKKEEPPPPPPPDSDKDSSLNPFTKKKTP